MCRPSITFNYTRAIRSEVVEPVPFARYNGRLVTDVKDNCEEKAGARDLLPSLAHTRADDVRVGTRI